MATVIKSTKAASVNPLKMSQPLGACYAFLGMNNAMPVMHGSQGCASLGLVLLGRHHRESIPIQTTAVNEVASILGGPENLEQAILNIRQRAQPDLIGVCSTGLTETRGDDLAGHLELIRKEHAEIADTAIVHVSTPDYVGAFQDGWASAVLATIRAFARRSQGFGMQDALSRTEVRTTKGHDQGRSDFSPTRPHMTQQINILAGCHLTVADVEEIREIVESFGLTAVVLPDLSGSLDGHIPDEFTPTSFGGTTLPEMAAMGESAVTLAIGEQMRACAAELETIAGVPYVMFDRLTGLEPNDRFLSFLSKHSSKPVPAKYRRQRSQLLDAMLDAHFAFGGKKVAVAAEPDLLWALSSWIAEMGATVGCAVTTTDSPLLKDVLAKEVLIGDLEDFEQGAVGCDLLITHSHGRQASERLGIPLYRAGLPMFDRLGAAHQLSVGYRGTRTLAFAVGNHFLATAQAAHPGQWALPQTSLDALAETDSTDQPLEALKR